MCLQFKVFTAAESISIFILLSGFLLNFFELFLLPQRKKGGSACLDLVFMRRSVGLNSGSPTPRFNEEIGLNAGPTCQIK